jgi:hypothetical protein
MKLLSLLFAGTMLFAPVSYEESVDVSEVTSEVVEENTSIEETTETTTEITTEDILTEEDKAELLELLEQWVNGEIELDEATAQLIREKLAPVLEQNLDKLLAKYIEESEERQKVTAVAMAVLGALCSFLVMLLFTKGIKKNNLKATINNESFSKSAKIMADTIADNKKEIKEMREMLEQNNKSYMNLLDLIEKAAKQTEKNNNAIMGVLKLTYKEGAENGTMEKELEQAQSK